MISLQIDDNNVIEEIKPGLLAIRQTSTINGHVNTVYFTKEMIKWIAGEI